MITLTCIITLFFVTFVELSWGEDDEFADDPTRACMAPSDNPPTTKSKFCTLLFGHDGPHSWESSDVETMSAVRRCDACGAIGEPPYEGWLVVTSHERNQSNDRYSFFRGRSQAVIRRVFTRVPA